MALCSFLFGLYYALYGTASALPKAFAVVMIYGYMFSFAMGMGSIPWLIMGEIFPPRGSLVFPVCESPLLPSPFARSDAFKFGWFAL